MIFRFFGIEEATPENIKVRRVLAVNLGICAAIFAVVLAMRL